MSMDALATVTGASRTIPVVVVLDRFDGHHDIHRRNRQWLADRPATGWWRPRGRRPALADLALGAAAHRC